MKKIFLLLPAFLLTAVSTFAQWRIGVSAGASYNWYAIEKHYMTDFRYQGLWDATAALSGQYDINSWLGVRAELEYLQKDHRFYRTEGYSETNYRTINSYLQLPILAVFRYGGDRLKGFTHLGGYVGYWVAGFLDGTLLNPSDKKAVTLHEPYTFIAEKDCRFDAGLSAGTGLEYTFHPHWTAQLEVRLNYGLVSTVKDYMAIKDYRYNSTASLRLGIQYNF